MINFIQYKNQFNNFKFLNNNVGLKTNSINTIKLAPLTKDTVSFSGQKHLNKSLMEAFDNQVVCEQVRLDADIPMNALKKTLKTAMTPFVFSKEINPEGLVEGIETRLKSADSLREKVSSELCYAITSPEPYAFNPNSPDDIKKAVGDIIGARIVLRKTDATNSTKMIDSLIEQVENGSLNITKIANYVLDETDEDVQYFAKVYANGNVKEIANRLKYFKDQDVARLLQVINNKNKEEGRPKIELEQRPKKTGYMALHLDVDTSNQDYKVKNNNYQGEIQIIGHDVSKLKEVEDFCYKIKQGKDIKNGHPAYRPFSDHLCKYLKDSKNYPGLSANFMQYTKRAYIAQRLKNPEFNASGKRKITYPSIKDCGMSGKIPQGLDFGVLFKLKSLCDEVYKIMENE